MSTTVFNPADHPRTSDGKFTPNPASQANPAGTDRLTLEEEDWKDYTPTQVAAFTNPKNEDILAGHIRNAELIFDKSELWEAVYSPQSYWNDSTFEGWMDADRKDFIPAGDESAETSQAAHTLSHMVACEGWGDLNEINDMVDVDGFLAEMQARQERVKTATDRAQNGDHIRPRHLDHRGRWVMPDGF